MGINVRHLSFGFQSFNLKTTKFLPIFPLKLYTAWIDWICARYKLHTLQWNVTHSRKKKRREIPRQTYKRIVLSSTFDDNKLNFSNIFHTFGNDNSKSTETLRCDRKPQKPFSKMNILSVEHLWTEQRTMKIARRYRLQSFRNFMKFKTKRMETERERELAFGAHLFYLVGIEQSVCNGLWIELKIIAFSNISQKTTKNEPIKTDSCAHVWLCSFDWQTRSLIPQNEKPKSCYIIYENVAHICNHIISFFL